MPYYPPLTPTQIRYAVRAYNAGMSCRAIAKQLGSRDFEGRCVKRVLKQVSVYQIGRQPLRRKTRYQLDESFFSVIDTEPKAYWLGFIAADGCITIDRHHRKYLRIKLHKKDRGHLALFLRAIHGTHPIKPARRNAVHICISSQQMITDLVKLGITPKKSNTLRFPIIPGKLQRHMIRGIFDGDGCACHRKNTSTFSFSFVGTTDVLAHIHTCVALGTSRPHRIKRCRYTYQLSYSGRELAHMVAHYLYAKSTTWLTRKRNKYLKYAASYPRGSSLTRLKNPVLRELCRAGQRDLRKSVPV